GLGSMRPHDPRQPDLERRALPGSRAARGDGAAMALDQPLHDGETGSEPALGAVQRAFTLHEDVEDPRQQIGRDAETIVGDLDDGIRTFTARPDLNLTPGIGVFDGIAEDVCDALHEAVEVTDDIQRLVTADHGGLVPLLP